jgi:drug/metabolite transporter (DMT)-like permease
MRSVAPSASRPISGWLAPAPLFFVVLWSTGFIAAKYGLPYAPPLSFLILRCLGALLVLLPLVLARRRTWPRGRILHVAVAGLLLQAGYLGGVWSAIKIGMPAGLSALIVGLQPILTAFAAPLVGERVTPRQWLGLLLGLGGVGLVVYAKISLNGLSPAAIGPLRAGAAVDHGGTLYQKRFCPQFDLRTGTLIQFAATALVLAAAGRRAGRLRTVPGQRAVDAAIHRRAAVVHPRAVDRRHLSII